MNLDKEFLEKNIRTDITDEEIDNIIKQLQEENGFDIIDSISVKACLILYRKEFANENN